MADPGRCSQCGQQIQQGQNFCVSCGSAVVQNNRSSTDPLIGQVLCDKYEVRSVLGAGSMGVVYRATHLNLGNDLAIKVLRRRLVSDKNVVRRFKQEARAASRLRHPNTIQILDFGEFDDGELFMAMELVDGRDLAMLIQQEGPLPPSRLAHITTQVCSALYEAHDNGIVHRDLKPANVLVANLRSQRDFVKVLDFGIAKMLDPDPSQSVPMTRDGFVCGTPAFMSPEQVQGFDLDGRSDLFALGVCLYQALTGKLPFKAPTPLELATALVTEDPVPPAEARPEWKPDPILSEVCMRALEKKPEDRFPTAMGMLDALAPVRSESSRSLLPSVESDAVVTQPDLPATDEHIETKVKTPALTPSTTPNKAHLDLPAAERRASGAEELQTVEMMRLPIEARRKRTRNLLMLGGAALAGFLLVTLALDRIVPTKAPPKAPVVEPVPEASPPPVKRPASPGIPRVVGVRAPTKATPAPKARKKRKKKRRPGASAAPAAANAPPAAAAPVAPKPPPAVKKKDRVRQLHADASAALRAGDQKAALRLLKTAVRIDPGYAPLHRDLGKLYMRQRNRKKGVAHYKRYVKLSPDAADAKAFRTIIRRFE